MSEKITVPRWTKKFLFACAAYYAACGFSALLWPSSWVWVAGLTTAEPANVNLLLAVLSGPLLAFMVAALLAAFAPFAQWSLIALLLIVNILDLFTNLYAAQAGYLPLANAALFAAIALVWSAGLALVLAQIYRSYLNADTTDGVSLETALATRPMGSTTSLGELSERGPLLLVLVRHTGCTFCRENLARIAVERKKITGEPPRIVIVGLSPAEPLRELADSFGFHDALIVSDPERLLYRALQIRRGSLWQLFGPRELFSAFINGALFRHGIGAVQGDPFQLPGIAVISHRKLVAVHAATSAADYCEVLPLIERGGAAM